MRRGSVGEIVERFRGRSATCCRTNSWARLMPIFSSIARVLSRSPRTTARIASIERVTSLSPSITDSRFGLAPMRLNVRRSFA